MKCRYVEMSVVVHATESLDRVVETLRNFFGEIPIVVEIHQGHYGNPIYLLTSFLENCDTVLDRLCDILRSIQPAEDGVYYIRLDKQLLARGEARLATHDDIVRIKLRARDGSCG
ncbi:MAG: RNA-binding domain-containing protein [Pyrobaculum sp.]